MPLKRPSAQKSVINDPNYGKRQYDDQNPFAFQVRNLKFDKEKGKGDFARIYILSFEEGDVQKVFCRLCSIYGKDGTPVLNKYKDKETGRQEVMTLPFHDPGKPHSDEIEDARGVAMSDCKMTVLFRLPIFLHSISRFKNNKYEVEEVMELRYLECSGALFEEIKELSLWQDGAGAFNSETGLPDYAIKLFTKENGQSYKYAVEPILKAGKEDDPDWQVDVATTVEKYLGTDGEFDYDTAWEALVEAISERTSVEALKQRFAPRKQSGAGSKAISNRPSLADAQEPDEDEEETAEEAAERVAEQTTVGTRTSRFSKAAEVETEEVEEQEAEVEEKPKTNSRFGSRFSRKA